MLIKEIDTYIAKVAEERINLRKQGMDLTENTQMLDTLKFIKSRLENAHLEKPDMTEEDEAWLLLNLKEERQKTIEVCQSLGREYLVEQEKKEMHTIEMLMQSLPHVEREQGPDEKTLREFTAASVTAYLLTKGTNYNLSMRDMKPIMEIVKKQYPSADGGIIASEVKKIIGQ